MIKGKEVINKISPGRSRERAQGRDWPWERGRISSRICKRRKRAWAVRLRYSEAKDEETKESVWLSPSGEKWLYWQRVRVVVSVGAVQRFGTGTVKNRRSPGMIKKIVGHHWGASWGWVAWVFSEINLKHILVTFSSNAAARHRGAEIQSG